jgi:hypothetical protein
VSLVTFRVFRVFDVLDFVGSNDLDGDGVSIVINDEDGNRRRDSRVINSLNLVIHYKSF